mmetsp:Transcript_6773/g.11378  ORF Transcript_6773/g.11378 Transcript_6773/m.11378 type:complete len:125 (+) Transcript_6773:24-398(+)
MNKQDSYTQEKRAPSKTLLAASFLLGTAVTGMGAYYHFKPSASQIEVEAVSQETVADSQLVSLAAEFPEFEDDITTMPSMSSCLHDEARNARGSNRCYSNTDCAGDRYCSPHGWCTGPSHCPRR